MTVLTCVKPGAKSGQVILLVDLTLAGNHDEVMATLQQLGYTPEIRHVSYRSGVHVLAVLKDEQHESLLDENYLIDEWLQLRDSIAPEAVHLWRGMS